MTVSRSSSLFVMLLVSGFLVFSNGGMIISNKALLATRKHVFPFPILLTFFQILTCVIGALILLFIKPKWFPFIHDVIERNRNLSKKEKMRINEIEGKKTMMDDIMDDRMMMDEIVETKTVFCNSRSVSQIMNRELLLKLQPLSLTFMGMLLFPSMSLEYGELSFLHTVCLSNLLLAYIGSLLFGIERKFNVRIASIILFIAVGSILSLGGEFWSIQKNPTSKEDVRMWHDSSEGTVKDESTSSTRTKKAKKVVPMYSSRSSHENRLLNNEIGDGEASSGIIEENDRDEGDDQELDDREVLHPPRRKNTVGRASEDVGNTSDEVPRSKQSTFSVIDDTKKESRVDVNTDDVDSRVQKSFTEKSSRSFTQRAKHLQDEELLTNKDYTPKSFLESQISEGSKGEYYYYTTSDRIEDSILGDRMILVDDRILGDEIPIVGTKNKMHSSFEEEYMTFLETAMENLYATVRSIVYDVENTQEQNQKKEEALSYFAILGCLLEFAGQICEVLYLLLQNVMLGFASFSSASHMRSREKSSQKKRSKDRRSDREARKDREAQKPLSRNRNVKKSDMMSKTRQPLVDANGNPHSSESMKMGNDKTVGNVNPGFISDGISTMSRMRNPNLNAIDYSTLATENDYGTLGIANGNGSSGGTVGSSGGTTSGDGTPICHNKPEGGINTVVEHALEGETGGINTLSTSEIFSNLNAELFSQGAYIDDGNGNIYTECLLFDGSSDDSSMDEESVVEESIVDNTTRSRPIIVGDIINGGSAIDRSKQCWSKNSWRLEGVESAILSLQEVTNIGNSPNDGGSTLNTLNKKTNMNRGSFSTISRRSNNDIVKKLNPKPKIDEIDPLSSTLLVAPLCLPLLILLFFLIEYPKKGDLILAKVFGIVHNNSRTNSDSIVTPLNLSFTSISSASQDVSIFNWVLSNCLLCFLSNFAMSLFMLRDGTPMGYSVCGLLADLLVIFSGLVIYQETSSSIQILGLVIQVVGVILYIIVRTFPDGFPNDRFFLEVLWCDYILVLKRKKTWGLLYTSFYNNLKKNCPEARRNGQREIGDLGAMVFSKSPSMRKNEIDWDIVTRRVVMTSKGNFQEGNFHEEQDCPEIESQQEQGHFDVNENQERIINHRERKMNHDEHTNQQANIQLTLSMHTVDRSCFDNQNSYNAHNQQSDSNDNQNWTSCDARGTSYDVHCTQNYQSADCHMEKPIYQGSEACGHPARSYEVYGHQSYDNHCEPRKKSYELCRNPSQGEICSGDKNAVNGKIDVTMKSMRKM